jgi:ADP-heptose:LPS heptosyltransferase
MRGTRASGGAIGRRILALSLRPTALVLRALGVGDLLTGVPALRGLRGALPEHRIVLAAPTALAPLVRLSGAVDALHPASGLSGLGWNGARPDVAVNLHGRGPQSSRLLMALRPASLLAFGCATAGCEGPDWDPTEHEVERWCRLVREHLGAGVDVADLRLAYPTAPSPYPGAVVIHPGAAYAARRWPWQRFAAVADELRRDGCTIVVTGSADERPLALSVAAAAGLDASAVLAGRTSLEDLAALVSRAALVVCGDTGVGHLATAYGTPSVLLFGPMPPSLWGPPQNGLHTVLWRGRQVADPMADRVDPALLRIEVDEVTSAARAQLRAAAAL